MQKMGGIPEYMEIAESFFTEEEAAEIQESGSSERFYQHWASKRGVYQSAGYRFKQRNGLLFCRGNRIIENGKVKSGWEISNSDKRLCRICGSTGERKVIQNGKIQKEYGTI